MNLQPIRQVNAVAARPNLGLALASSAAEIEEAQRLRYQVFAEEMGAHLLQTGLSTARRIDRDAFDPYCEHLIVRDLDSGEVVGTYRILPPDAVRAAGGYYSEQEFDLRRIAHLRDGLVEVGRSCVRPGYRSGATILLLWSGLVNYMTRHRCSHLFGCASIPMVDGGREAALVWRHVQTHHLGPEEHRVFPLCRLPVERLEAAGSGMDARQPVRLPPLIKGYFNAGALACGEPAWDPDFNTADLPVILSIHSMSRRYGRHFGLNMISQ